MDLVQRDEGDDSVVVAPAVARRPGSPTSRPVITVSSSAPATAVRLSDAVDSVTVRVGPPESLASRAWAGPVPQVRRVGPVVQSGEGVFSGGRAFRASNLMPSDAHDA
jgi:hypothetical protein